MCPSPVHSPNKNAPPEALARSLDRVWREEKQLRQELAPDPVHDIRVALRRCRSLAEGFGTLDKHDDWRRLRKAAKELQDGFAKLRDAQVMAKGVRRLHIGGGTDGAAVAELLRRDERKGKRKAELALRKFPHKRWKRWRRRLPKRAERIGAAPIAFADLALDRAKEASARERRWRGSESQLAAHSLRIAVKHFRYTVQSFLPEQYAAWEKDLQRMQDCLGEMHDLDVLRGWLLKVAKKESIDRKTVDSWMRRIAGTREERVAAYKKAVSDSGKHAGQGKRIPTRWDRWRLEIAHLVSLNSPGHEGVSA